MIQECPLLTETAYQAVPKCDWFLCIDWSRVELQMKRECCWETGIPVWEIAWNFLYRSERASVIDNKVSICKSVLWIVGDFAKSQIHGCRAYRLRIVFLKQHIAFSMKRETLLNASSKDMGRTLRNLKAIERELYCWLRDTIEYK